MLHNLNMENYEETIGIDVSKKTIDVSCHLSCKHKVFGNDIKDIDPC